MTKKNRNPRHRRTPSTSRQPGPEVTVTLLCSENDFRSMHQACPTPEFGDYARYRERTRLVLRDLRRHGGRVWVRPFDPDDYRSFCSAEQLPADRVQSRAQYFADARLLPPRLYAGEPLDVLFRRLALQRDDERTAAAALELLELATDPGDDPKETTAFASAILVTLVRGVSLGVHKLTCVMDAGPEQLSIQAEFEKTAHQVLSYAPQLHIFTTVLAAAYALGESATVTIRTRDDQGDTVRGWRLNGERMEPLSAVEVRSACSKADRYEPGFPLPDRPPPH
ncbi:hypothetical protein SMC26_22070 [Actinomadura fulvescens]|uniref:Uncharacterized protein n=1 Tax=Actinomadura fulvescens TaxID=46160 RepID=A0ABN3PFZ3_9ACTN